MAKPDLIKSYVNELKAALDCPVEEVYVYTETIYGVKHLCVTLKVDIENLDALENGMKRLVAISDDYGYNTDCRDGIFEAAIPVAQELPNGKFEPLPTNSDELTKAWKKLEAKNRAKLAAKKIKKAAEPQKAVELQPESEPQAAAEHAALAEKTFGKVASEVWNDQKDRNDIIGAAILAGLLMLGACIATEYINVKDAEDQKVGAKLKEATKKTAKNHRTWLKVGIFAILAGGVTFACKYKARS